VWRNGIYDFLRFHTKTREFCALRVGKLAYCSAVPREDVMVLPAGIGYRCNAWRRAPTFSSSVSNWPHASIGLDAGPFWPDPMVAYSTFHANSSVKKTGFRKEVLRKTTIKRPQ
jgi:hypothetical protein